MCPLNNKSSDQRSKLENGSKLVSLFWEAIGVERYITQALALEKCPMIHEISLEVSHRFRNTYHRFRCRPKSVECLCFPSILLYKHIANRSSAKRRLCCSVCPGRMPQDRQRDGIGCCRAADVERCEEREADQKDQPPTADLREGAEKHGSKDHAHDVHADW